MVLAEVSGTKGYNFINIDLSLEHSEQIQDLIVYSPVMLQHKPQSIYNDTFTGWNNSWLMLIRKTIKTWTPILQILSLYEEKPFRLGRKLHNRFQAEHLRTPKGNIDLC